ncbi:restriction endonuclease subunit S [Vagococcus fluvialis]|uniref:restriction endonuclease subunit S n=2 Tax=Vagococcus fluvialis TaxID=2738 RepID=UPI003D0F7856
MVAWEQRKLGDGLSKVGDGIHGTPEYREDGLVPFINGNNLVDGNVLVTDETKYVDELQKTKNDNLLNSNTILMSINGTIGNLARYNGENIMLGKSTAYLIVEEYSKEYVYYLLQTNQIYKHFMSSLTGTTIKNLGLKIIKETPCLIPRIEEQTKIGNFFKQLDETITLQERELELLKLTKKSFLQQLFPETNQLFPNIRFANFQDEWQQRKFEDMLDIENGVRRGPFGSALKKEFFIKNSDYVVYEQQNAIYDNYETRYNISKEKFDELKVFKLLEKDFIMSGAGTIGRISRVPKGIKQGVFNQALIRFRINGKITDAEYFIQFIRAEKMQRKLTGANPGSAITNLVPMSEVKKWDILVPKVEEQIEIGFFLNRLDEAITLQKRKLDKLKKMKKSFLQKMFI